MAETARDDAKKHNVTPQFIASAERQFVESAEKLETAKGKHRNLIKQLKADGINIDKLKAVITLKRQDPTDVLGEYRDFIRYAKVLLLPIGAQLSLLDEEMPEDELDAQQAEEQVAWDAGEQGKAAGKSGATKESNPFQAGTLAFAAWDLCWSKGAELRAAGGVGKRGRPKKATDPAAGTA